MNNPIDYHAALAAARRDHALARSRLDECVRAELRGRQVADAAQRVLVAAQLAEEDAASAHADRLGAAIASGSTSLPPLVTFDDRNHRAAVQGAAIANKALAGLVAMRAEAEEAERATKAVEVRTEEQKLIALREQLAIDAIGAHRAFVEKYDQLLASFPDERFETVTRSLPSSPNIQLALNLMPRRDDLHVSVAELRGAFPRRAVPWAERRAALIDGALENSSAPAETAAA